MMDKALSKALKNIKTFSRKAMFMKKNSMPEEECCDMGGHGEEQEDEETQDLSKLMDEDEESGAKDKSQKYTLMVMTGGHSGGKLKMPASPKRKKRM